MTNYLITVPIHHSRSEEAGEALIEHVISKCCAPKCIIMDQDSTFMFTLMNYLFRKPIQYTWYNTWYYVTIQNFNKTLPG